MAKYHQIIHTLPRLLTAAETLDYVAGATVMGLLTNDHGLKPVVKRNGLCVYDRTEIDHAVEKLKQAARRNED